MWTTFGHWKRRNIEKVYNLITRRESLSCLTKNGRTPSFVSHLDAYLTTWWLISNLKWFRVKFRSPGVQARYGFSLTRKFISRAKSEDLPTFPFISLKGKISFNFRLQSLSAGEIKRKKEGRRRTWKIDAGTAQSLIDSVSKINQK